MGGGMADVDRSLEKGVVLVMSLWDDHGANMLWLDSTYPTDSTDPTNYRGSCGIDWIACGCGGGQRRCECGFLEHQICTHGPDHSPWQVCDCFSRFSSHFFISVFLCDKCFEQRHSHF